MNKRLIKNLAIVVFLLSYSVCNVFAQQKPTVAVYVVNNDDDNSETKAIKKVLGDKFVEAIVNSGLFRAVERTEEFLAQIRREHDYQHSGNVDDKEIVRMAHQLGAMYVCITDVYEAYGEKYVTARLIDVELNQILAKVNSTGTIKSMNDLVSIANEVSTNLIKKTPQGEKIAEERANKEIQDRLLYEKDCAEKQKAFDKQIKLLSFVPGAAQLKKGEKTKSILFIGGEAVLIIGAVAMENLRANENSLFYTTHDKEIHSQNARTYGNIRNGLIGGAIALYVWNVIDGIVTKSDKQKALCNNKMKILPYINTKAGGLLLAFNF